MKMNSNEEFNLDALAALWQQESDRVDKIVREHPVSHAPFHRHARRLSQHRRLLMLSLAFALAGVAALVWLIVLYDRYVVDAMDLVAHIFIAIPLLFVIVGSLLTASFLFWRRIPATPMGVENLHIPRLVAAVAIVAVFLVVATPAYDGRAMSERGIQQRNMTMNMTTQILDNFSTAAI